MKKTPDLDHFRTQYGTLGRPFRLSGISKSTRKENNNDWIYSFKYLDEQGGFFEIKIFNNGRIEKL